jgi:hypothetical protein
MTKRFHSFKPGSFMEIEETFSQLLAFGFQDGL